AAVEDEGARDLRGAGFFAPVEVVLIFSSCAVVVVVAAAVFAALAGPVALRRPPRCGPTVVVVVVVVDCCFSSAGCLPRLLSPGPGVENGAAVAADLAPVDFLAVVA